MGRIRLNKQEKQVLKKKYIGKYGVQEGRYMADLRAQILESYLNIKKKNVIA